MSRHQSNQNVYGNGKNRGAIEHGESLRKFIRCFESGGIIFV